MWRNDVPGPLKRGRQLSRGHVPAAMRRQDARIEGPFMSRIKLAVAVLLLLVGIVGVGLMVAAATPGNEPAGRAAALVGQLAAAAAWTTTLVTGTFDVGRQRAPAVVAGLAVLIVVPLVALATRLARRLGASQALRQISVSRARRAADAAALPRLANVWIDVDGPGRHRHRLAGELTRIGRDEENDLQLQDPNVHRHHALIQRTSDAEFVVVDVSGVRGNGVAVNGRRLARARLRDGDLIEIGTARVRFRCELISHAMSA
jgi:FHA domain